MSDNTEVRPSVVKEQEEVDVKMEESTQASQVESQTCESLPEYVMESALQPMSDLMTFDTYPPGNEARYDNFALMLGVYCKYTVLRPTDVYHKYLREEKTTPRPDLSSIPPEFPLLPIAELAVDIMKMPEFAEATVINLKTDTRQLTDPKIMYHLKHLHGPLLNRTEWQGQYKEKWAMIYVNTSVLPGCIHAVWAAVFLIEALATAFPNKHYVLRDHDTTPLALYEIEQLVKLTQSLRISFLTNLTARPG